MIFRLPPDIEMVYPPASEPVTRSVIAPEAVPLTPGSPTMVYPPATLVRVMVWPTERWTCWDPSRPDLCRSCCGVVLLGGASDAATAGYAMSSARMANTPSVAATAVFFVFISVMD